MQRIILTLVLLFIVVPDRSAFSAVIDRIRIDPALPSNTDPIAITVEGIMNWSVNVQFTSFTRSGNDLQISVWLREGLLPVVTPWSHSEEIGPLAPGVYHVNADVAVDGAVSNMKRDFTVIPEPSSMAMLGVACALFLHRRRS